MLLNLSPLHEPRVAVRRSDHAHLFFVNSLLCDSSCRTKPKDSVILRCCREETTRKQNHSLVGLERDLNVRNLL